MKLSEFESFLHTQIPLAKALGARLVRVDESLAEIRAPLELNRNHMGTAFGGSLNALLVLACYVWLYHALEKRQWPCHVVLKTSQTKYLLPVSGPVETVCLAPSPSEFEKFLRSLKRKNLARITLHSQIKVGSKEACLFEGEFVALK